MRPSFNTAGPCVRGEHYMLPPERRLKRVLKLIDEHKFFTLTAGRQTGKTTCAKWLVRHLNSSGRYCAVHVDVQTARDTNSPLVAFKAIRYDFEHALQRDLPDVGLPSSSVRLIKPPNIFLLRYIRDLAVRAPKPLVLLFDEADALIGKAVVDDIAYCLGLGIVRKHRGGLEIANPIYREIIPRTLSWGPQLAIQQETAWYVRPDGSLDIPKLMREWQTFWRKDGHIAAEGFGYRESGPHLMLMAFLQRIINGGGRIEREYGLGRGALDLIVFWKEQRHIIEVKMRRDTETETDALDQIARYLDHLGLSEGWMVMFDLRKELAWADKLFVREIEHAGKLVRLVGC